MSGVLTLNFIPKKGGSWWAIHLSVMSGVGGLQNSSLRLPKPNQS
ncbi:hypothetical protein HPHPP26_1582 [Helicobacter pylori Hp P-26]|nr:hypothetical protein HPHPP26_1582 [Helicobacter pylori Hp P-26]